MKTKFILLLGPAFIAACSTADRLGPISGIGSVTGSWVAQFPMSIPGNALGFTLRDSAGVVSGAGYFAGEAGPFGKLDIAGKSVGDSVSLHITYVYDTLFHAMPASTATFDGKLVTHDDLIGVLNRDGFASTVHLQRGMPQ
jgi:hypothetical protein